MKEKKACIDAKYSMTARNLRSKLGYKQWRSFNGIIERAQQIINSGEAVGIIVKTTYQAKLGSGSIRLIDDFELDDMAVDIIAKLSEHSKLHTRKLRMRNETILLGLLKKYCDGKNISFQFQAQKGSFRFDAMVERKILIEFDEPHHGLYNQGIIDDAKDEWAKANDYILLRFDLSMDIIDMIFSIENNR